MQIPPTPKLVDADVALAALPADLRAILKALGDPGRVLACGYHALLTIKGDGSYAEGAQDGLLVGLVLGGLNAAWASKAITEQVFDQCHAHVLALAVPGGTA